MSTLASPAALSWLLVMALVVLVDTPPGMPPLLPALASRSLLSAVARSAALSVVACALVLRDMLRGCSGDVAGAGWAVWMATVQSAHHQTPVVHSALTQQAVWARRGGRGSIAPCISPPRCPPGGTAVRHNHKDMRSAREPHLRTAPSWGSTGNPRARLSSAGAFRNSPSSRRVRADVGSSDQRRATGVTATGAEHASSRLPPPLPEPRSRRSEGWERFNQSSHVFPCEEFIKSEISSQIFKRSNVRWRRSVLREAGECGAGGMLQVADPRVRVYDA